MKDFNKNESQKIEFKESLAELDDAGATLAGFANQQGGTIYFGIRNNGQVVGLKHLTDKTVRDITQRLFDNLEPQMAFSIEKINIQNEIVIKVDVQKSETPYHTYKGKPYIRIGNSTKLMPQEEYQLRLIRFKSTNKDYSSTTIKTATSKDLDTRAMRRLRKLLSDSNRYDLDIKNLSDEQLLKDLLLVRTGKLTVAALVLLGTERALGTYLPYAEIRYAYRLVENEISNQDTHIFKGGYLLYYDKLWEKVNSRNITLSIPMGMRVVEKTAFDEQSIREAVNNAVVHRDYLLSESTFIFQYPTNITLKSPGGLPDGITIDNILVESKPRNKLIADILFKCNFVEQFGNGVNLMFRNQLSAGKSPPDYSETTAGRVMLKLEGTVQDQEFAKYVLRVADSKKKSLNDYELVVLYKIRTNQNVKPEKITQQLLDMGLIEKAGFDKYILSKQYYKDVNQRGVYTKRKGLSKNHNKELIIQHLKDFGYGQKQDFAQIFDYTLSERQVESLLESLKRAGRIYFDGKPRSHTGVWRLGQK